MRVSGPVAAIAAALLIVGCSSSSEDGDGGSGGSDSAGDKPAGTEESPDADGASETGVQGSWGSEGQLLHIASGIGTLVDAEQVCVGSVTGTALALACPNGADTFTVGEAALDGSGLTVDWNGTTVSYTRLAGPEVDLGQLELEGVDLAEFGLDDLSFDLGDIDLGDIDLGDLGDLGELPDLDIELP